ncbi:unnamed protein product [Wuchereria bancrofti]|uniref:Uncharacterized protein n=1 Tax=Wuchereria bancrofti TaxID=6293 RepID=A0A3P7F1B2_WUCBA|nr:unnamed protein product [Wuchereria bancrofti]
MSPDDIPSTKNPSLFLSLFLRKKRINRSVTESLDDNKKVTSPSTVRFLANGKTDSNTNVTHTNDHNNLENSEMSMVPSFESASTSLIDEFQLPKLSSFQQQKQQQKPQYEPTKTDFTFIDRNHKRYYKNFHKNYHIKTDDLLSTQSDILSNVRSRSESRSIIEKSPVFPVLSMPKKAYSIGAMNHSDPEYLMEALETLADTQPRVARSIPKHAIIDTSNFAARSLDNCLFDATVYDAMLHDSLKVFFSFFVFFLSLFLFSINYFKKSLKISYILSKKKMMMLHPIK